MSLLPVNQASATFGIIGKKQIILMSRMSKMIREWLCTKHCPIINTRQRKMSGKSSRYYNNSKYFTGMLPVCLSKWSFHPTWVCLHQDWRQGRMKSPDEVVATSEESLSRLTYWWRTYEILLLLWNPIKKAYLLIRHYILHVTKQFCSTWCHIIL